MDELIKQFEEFWKNNTELAKILVAALVGALLTKTFPTLWSYFLQALSFVGEKIGGRFAYKSIQDAYLNWVVLQNQDLNLTGIVGSGEKPKLEQVFVSLKIVEELGTEVSEEPRSRDKNPSVVETFINQTAQNAKSAGKSIGSIISSIFPPKATPKPTPIKPLFVPSRFWRVRLIWERSEIQNIIGYTIAFVLLGIIPFWGLFIMDDVNNFLAGYGAFIITFLAIIIVMVAPSGFNWKKPDDWGFVIILGILPLTALAYILYSRVILQQQSPQAIAVGSLLCIGGGTAIWLYGRLENIRGRIKAPNAKAAGKLLSSNDNIAILGRPGAGKSTYAQFLALTFAQEKAGERKLRKSGIAKKRFGQVKWLLPLVVPLRKVSGFLDEPNNHSRTNLLIDAFRNQVLPSDIRGIFSDSYITHMLQKKQCLFLLDGLDEVADDNEFQAVTREIIGLISRFPGNKFILTSRYAGWRGGLGSTFHKFEIENLSKKQIRNFINCWYDAVEENRASNSASKESIAERLHRKRRAEENASKLHQALNEVSSIRNLAENPLLLSIVCFVHYHKTLPKERLGLYQDCSNLLLVQWDREKGLAVDDTNLTLARKEAIMQEIAFALHSGRIGKHSGGKEATGAEIIPIVESMLSRYKMDTALASSLFHRLVDRSGIMVIVEKFKDRYAFSHLTFQEFYAAKHIHEKHLDIFGVIAQLTDAPSDALGSWWREVVLLHSAMGQDASHSIKRLCDGTPNDLLKRHLPIAAQCLSEAVSVSEHEVESRLLRELLEIRCVQRPCVGKTGQPEIRNYLLRFAQTDAFYKYLLLSTIQAVSDNKHAEKLLSILVQTLGSSNRQIKLYVLQAITMLSKTYTIECNIKTEIQGLLKSHDTTLVWYIVRLIFSSGPKPLDDEMSKTLVDLIGILPYDPTMFDDILDSELFNDGQDHEKAFTQVLGELIDTLIYSERLNAQEKLLDFLRKTLNGEHNPLMTDSLRIIGVEFPLRRDHLQPSAPSVVKTLFKLDDLTQVSIHKQQLLDAISKGTLTQQSSAIVLFSGILTSDDDTKNVIISKLTSPHSDVRIAALGTLSKLNLNDEEKVAITAILKQSLKDVSKFRWLQCHCEQMIGGKGHPVLKLNERILAIESLAILKTLPEEANLYRKIISLYSELSRRERWERMRDMPESVVTRLADADIDKIIEILHKDKAEQQSDENTSRDYLVQAAETLGNLGIWHKGNALPTIATSLFEMVGEREDTTLKLAALRSIKKSNVKVTAFSEQHTILLRQLENRQMSIADTAFDILLDNQLV
jgi:hypothetical protein